MLQNERAVQACKAGKKGGGGGVEGSNAVFVDDTSRAHYTYTLALTHTHICKRRGGNRKVQVLEGVKVFITTA